MDAADVNDAPITIFSHMFNRNAGRNCRADQQDLDQCFPLVFGEVLNRIDMLNACVVYDAVNFTF